MKLCIADIHIKLGQKNVPKTWAEERYFMMFNQIEEAVQKHNVTEIIIPGDIFDAVPKLEELGIYYKMLDSFSVPTKISTGNHEALTKKLSFFQYLKEVSERINSNVEIVLDVTKYEDYYIVPYEFIKKEQTWKDLEELPVFTHVRGEIPPHVKPEIPLEWLEKFPVVFAGDLHSHENTQRNIVYPGSPVTTSFHRSLTDTGYLLIDSDWSWSWHKFNLPQLIRKTVSSEDEMVKTDFHHTIYELEGAVEDLAKVENSELLDKKIVHKNYEASLDLTKATTVEEELKTYYEKVQKLPEAKINKLLGLYHELNIS